MTPLQDRNTTAEQLAAMTGAIPMGRPGQPEDCVGAYLFLATDALSGFITGATVDVNGGAYLSCWRAVLPSQSDAASCSCDRVAS